MALPTSANNLDRTKLEDTQEAIQRLLLAGEGKIRFGWMEFPEDGGCLPGNVLEPCTDDSIANIQQRVQSLVANGGTPTGESLMNAASYGGLTDEIRSNFVVLLTDGKPSCPYGAGQVENNLEDQELAIQGTKELRMLGVDTFVIGLGEDLNASNPELLNQLAREGGRPRAGAVQYFSANSLGELVEAFDEIQAVIISCTITLSSIPQYPKNLWISLDSEPVNRDPKHQDGFDYDVERNQILFYGSACEKLRSGEVENIQIKMGCAPEI